VKQPGVGPQFRVGTVTAGRSLKIKNLTVENKNRQGDSACRGMAPKRASKQQQQLNVDQFKLLKKPMDHLGKQINVPGSFWQGRMLPEERDKVYKCTIVDFSLAHKFAPDSSPRMAFKMQEMGIDGTGSHEASDLASTMYWIDYPMPFLSFYYDTFPAVDDILAGAAEVASLARARGNGFNDSASNGCASSATVSHTDVHPEFPSLRIPSAVIYQFFKVISDKLIEMGPTSGKFAALWECTILDESGRACCNRRRINHDKNKTCQTSNLIAHLRERSARHARLARSLCKTCQAYVWPAWPGRSPLSKVGGRTGTLPKRLPRCIARA
jgi:hypothetical protein